ncbi:2-nitropropane dioxygenase [Gordonia paraffinivorans]|uniref:NAD(P)H-dependent flavin oxidoreductase n=1 Tax=Gordonia paraffinivorans TaxID=175628 RepID=UPI001C92CC24|nr:nitronate monooxygenase [Gordonia paraffinivorans]MBY4574929.1 2-nitropropane dioxygenase [Gordonia paraffinivorans]
MFDPRDLDVPVVAAPMAGGPTTPALVSAACGAGGLGQLAAGYLTPEKLASDIAAVRAAGTELFGVNIFVPETDPVDRAAVARYRERLLGYAAALDVDLPAVDELGDDDDHFDAKIALMCDERIPVVSFAFGCPPASAVAELHRHGCSVGVTVTGVDDAVLAAEAGADWLCVQGPDAGGHRSVFDRRAIPPSQPLDDLLRAVRGRLDLPLVAAGGISTRDRADHVRASGATAVQVGTVLLRTHEAGTKPAHADALADPARTETVVTLAFSGRPARALRNRFTDEFGEAAVAEYPAVNKLTGGLRRATADDPDGINLWAGTGYRDAVAEPAADTIGRLG